MGGTPVGAPIIGWVAEQWSPRVAILAGAAAAALVFLIAMAWLTFSGRVRRAEGRRFRLTLDDTQPIEIIPPPNFSDELAASTPVPLPLPTHLRAPAGRPTSPDRRRTQRPASAEIEN